MNAKLFQLSEVLWGSFLGHDARQLPKLSK